MLAIPEELFRKNSGNRKWPDLISCPITEQGHSRVLVVEDERKVAKALSEGLESDSYSVAVAHTGEEGFFMATSEQFDLIILDVMLPGRSGIEVLSALRRRSRGFPCFS